MKSKALKIVTFILVCLFSVLVISCGGNNQEVETRVQVDLNPSVEFILNKNDKVISATALNKDGEVIIFDEKFEGLNIEEAINKFINIANQTGYVDINKEENTITISVDSIKEDVKNLEQKITEKVNAFINENNLKVKLDEIKSLSREGLIKYVSLTTEYSLEELSEMTDKQVLACLGLSRLETIDMISVELREVYIKAKEYEISFVEKETTNEIISKLGSGYDFIAKQYKNALDSYKELINEIDNVRYNTFVKADSDYQTALQNLREAKEKYLKQVKVVIQIDENNPEYNIEVKLLEELRKAYDLCVKAFEKAGELANSALELVINSLQLIEKRLEELEKMFVSKEEFETKLAENAKAFEQKLNETKNTFFNKFEEAHKEDIEVVNNRIKEHKEKLKEIINEKSN